MLTKDGLTIYDLDPNASELWAVAGPEGSSYLWLGKAHLNRAEVSELVDHLTRWLATGSLSAT